MTDGSDFNASRRDFFQRAGLGAAAVGAASAMPQLAAAGETQASAPSRRNFAGGTPTKSAVAASPTDIPAPTSRHTTQTHDIELVSREVTAEVMPGVTHTFMTFNGQVPAPMIRVRQGDTLKVTVTNSSDNMNAHSIDLHAVYGSGGGAPFTKVAPGQSKSFTFRTLYPGAFIYHCGVDNLDEHMSRGMFGMILVEPQEGLPPVDREVYLGQHELYTKEGLGQKGDTTFDSRAMIAEDPTYVLFNGAFAGFTGQGFGPITAKVDETVRVFVVGGGPNLTSSLHPIGNVWSRCWPQGALANAPQRYVQTWPVSPGSAFVGEMELPVPQTINLVDHAISRTLNKGALAQIKVEGEERPDILNVG